MKYIGVLDGLTFCGLVVGQSVTMKRGVPDGVGAEDGVRVGKRVTKYMGGGCGRTGRSQ